MKSPQIFPHGATVSSILVDVACAAYKKGFSESLCNTAMQAIIDQFGLQIAGSQFPWSAAIYQYALQDCRTFGNSTIIKYGDKVSAVQAAFVNSCFAHAQDFDDSHQEAQTHPGSVIIPPAIAIGEQLGLSGKVVLNAIIIGMEVMLRLAHSICPACIEGGHHTPPTVGPFGVVISCGLLLGLNKSQLMNALGICGSYAGGLVEYTLSGGSVKRIHTGLAARAGLEAVFLARYGITGPKTIIEGKKGIWAVFAGDKVFKERLLSGFGEKFLLSTLMFKPYNCCYLINPAIEGFLAICKENNIAALDIENVEVGLSDFSISHAGKIILPEDALGAQFSTSFTLAMSLINSPPAMNSYSESVLTDQQILNLARKIKVIKDQIAHDEFPVKNGCYLKVMTMKGHDFSIRVRDPKGSPEKLMTNEQVKEKFMNNTIPVLGQDEATRIYGHLLNFNQIQSLNTVQIFI